MKTVPELKHKVIQRYQHKINAWNKLQSTVNACKWRGKLTEQEKQDRDHYIKMADSFHKAVDELVIAYKLEKKKQQYL